MDRISQIKTDLLMREWAQMVRECRSSGLTVKEWCANNGVNIKTYYYRLKRVRNYMCNNNTKLPAHHDIVPVPIETVPDDDNRQIKIITSTISVELPSTIQPQLLKAAIEVLKC